MVTSLVKNFKKMMRCWGRTSGLPPMAGMKQNGEKQEKNPHYFDQIRLVGGYANPVVSLETILGWEQLCFCSSRSWVQGCFSCPERS